MLQEDELSQVECIVIVVLTVKIRAEFRVKLLQY